MNEKQYPTFRAVSYDKEVNGEVQIIDDRYVLLVSCDGKQKPIDLISVNSRAADNLQWIAEKQFDIVVPLAAQGNLWLDETVPEERPKTMLYHWYLYQLDWYGKTPWVASGVVWNHPKLQNGGHMSHSSKVQSAIIDAEAEEVIVKTRNSEFHCPLKACDYWQESTYEYLPELRKYRDIYEPKQNHFEQEDGTVLLVLSDCAEYYFEYGAVKENNETTELTMHVHVGTFQDSCLIYEKGSFMAGRVDLRYFPHPGHIEFYRQIYDMSTQPPHNSGYPLYIENAGVETLYVDVTGSLRLELKPGERKLCCKENAIPKEEETPSLRGGDLYPAGLIIPDDEPSERKELEGGQNNE